MQSKYAKYDYNVPVQKLNMLSIRDQEKRTVNVKKRSKDIIIISIQVLKTR